MSFIFLFINLHHTSKYCNLRASLYKSFPGMLCVSEDKVLRGVYWGFWRQTLSVWDAGVHACSGFSCGMRRWIPGIKFVVKGLRWKTFTFSLRRMIVSRQNCGTFCLKTSKFPTEKPWFIACFAWFWMCFSSPQRFFFFIFTYTSYTIWRDC